MSWTVLGNPTIVDCEVCSLLMTVMLPSTGCPFSEKAMSGMPLAAEDKTASTGEPEISVLPLEFLVTVIVGLIKTRFFTSLVMDV